MNKIIIILYYHNICIKNIGGGCFMIQFSFSEKYDKCKLRIGFKNKIRHPEFNPYIIDDYDVSD